MGFLFGGSTGETQDSLDTKRKMALAMLARGMDASPIQSKWQGAARLAEAVMGGLDMHKQDVDQKDADAQLMSTVTGAPYTPPAQSPGFLSGLFGGGPSKVPASDAQGQVAATNPTPSQSGIANARPVASPGISASADASDLNAFLADPSRRSTLPAGMRNNNPGNIKFVGQKVPGIVGPSQNTDEGDPQAVFDTPESGMAAMHSLLLRKYDGGKVTPDQIIAGQGGWTPGNHAAAANVARYAGISPGDDINLHDPVMATKFMRGLMMQEHGKSSSLYPDAMIASVVGGRPAQAPQVASLDPAIGLNAGPQAPQQVAGTQIGGTAQGAPSIPGPQVASTPPQPGYVDPQVVSAYQGPASASPAAQAIQQVAPIPGPGEAMPAQMAQMPPQQTAYAGPAPDAPPQMAPPLPAPVNVPNQPMSNPMPADLSGVGMGGGAPGPGAFPPAPAMDPKARLAAALQGAPQPQGAPSDGSARLAAAMQGNPQGAAPAGDPAATPQTRLAQAMQAAPVAPNPMRDNPRVQQLMKAMMNPNASPQVKQMVGVALQQEMSKGQAVYQAQMEQYIKQQDPQYQATLKKAQYEADHLGQVSPDTAATIQGQQEKVGLEAQKQMQLATYQQHLKEQDPLNQANVEKTKAEIANAPNTNDIKEYNFAKQQGYPGTFADYELQQKAAGRPTTTINNGDNSSAFGKKADEEAATRFGGYISDGNAASRTLGDVQQLADLGTQINTGKGAQAIATLGPYAEAIGIDIKGLGPAQAYQAVISRMAPQMRPTGSGSSSDTDVKMFLNSLPSLGNSPDGNQIITQTLGAVQQQKIEAAKIASQAMLPKESGGITWQEAEGKIRDLGNPYETFNKYRQTLSKNGMQPLPSDSLTVPTDIPGVTIKRVQ